jgi:hypothetical protein
LINISLVYEGCGLVLDVIRVKVTNIMQSASKGY